MRFRQALTLLIALATSTCGYAQEEFVCGPPGRFWFSAEYLLWWTKGPSFPNLVTTGPADSATPAGSTSGLLGNPNTTILFGGDQDADLRSGARFNAGLWFNAEQTMGVTGRFYILETQNDTFLFDSNTAPVVVLPFFNPDGIQQRLPVVYPGETAGSTSFSLSSRFRAWDIDYIQNLFCGPSGRLDALIGFRCMRLNEDLTIRDIETDLTGNTTGIAGTTVDLTGLFDTRNTFCGVDLGLQFERRFGGLFVQVMGRVGLGCNNRTVNIQGFGTNFDPIEGTTPSVGGLYAQPSNIGTYRDNVFSVVPEIGINLGYEFTPNIRGFVNYSFLYWTNVVRSGDQIDTTIDPNQFVGLPGTVPAFNFQGTDFWAHGVSFGFALRY